MHDRLKQLRTALLAMLTFPPTLAHELCHAIVAFPGARRLSVVMEPGNLAASCHVEWRERTPRYYIIISHLAPLLAGLLALGVALLSWAETGMTAPESAIELFWWAFIAAWWTIFAVPSPSDLMAGDSDGGA